MFPPSLLFGLGLLSFDRWADFFPKWPLPREFSLTVIPKTFASNVFFPNNEPQSFPVFPGDPPITTGRRDPDFYVVSALPWDPVHMKPCVWLSRVESLFPPVLRSFSAQFLLHLNAKYFRGSSSQCQTPQVWEADMRLKTLTSMHEPLQYSYFPVLSLPHGGYEVCLYCIVAPPTVSIWPSPCLLL